MAAACDKAVGVYGKAHLSEEKDDQADVAKNPNAGYGATVVIATR